MEIEPSNPSMVVVKKLGKIIRILVTMLQRCLSKSKIMLDLQLILKQSKLAGKALNNLVHLQYHMKKHYSTLGCQTSTDIAPSLVTAREYEFSCSNSPAYPAFFSKRVKHHHGHFYGLKYGSSYKYDDVATVNAAVQRVLEMFNDATVAPSPLVSLPGFGKSPLVRQLRITDSPFPLKDDGGDGGKVDKAADEFIKKFYKDLKVQKSMASQIESPYRNYNNSWGQI